MKVFNIGDLVSLFDDPTEETSREGTAELLELLTADCGRYHGRTLQRWRVRFIDETDKVYARFVLTPREGS